ncbi:unnamed protein product [Linum trigynum]|uniref:Uncharacterized protein n=1 Tax=Linum trigynum TaxID=586398 RepID=A0AAV2DAC5_9ROSI
MYFRLRQVIAELNMDSANVIPSAQPQIYRSSVPWKRRGVFIHPEDQYQRCVLSAEEEEAFERDVFSAF